MKPPRTLGLQRDANDFSHNLKYAVEQLAKCISSISFGTTLSNTDADMNMNVWKVSGTTPGVINTEFAVTHNLTHVPIGFHVISTDKPAHLYKSTTAWTAASGNGLGTIYLKCDTVTVNFSLIVL